MLDLPGIWKTVGLFATYLQIYQIYEFYHNFKNLFYNKLSSNGYNQVYVYSALLVYR